MKKLRLLFFTLFSVCFMLPALAMEQQYEDEIDPLSTTGHYILVRTHTSPTRPRVPKTQTVTMQYNQAELTVKMAVPEGWTTLTIHEPIKGIGHIYSFNAGCLNLSASLPQLDNGTTVFLETEWGNTYYGIITSETINY